jgi:hypothetical protein
MTTTSPKLEVVSPDDEPMAIAKPGAFSLDKFKSKRGASLAGVETLQTALPHHSMAQAKDFVRLHHQENYWSDELCFVSVPIKGQKRETLHLIDEDVAMAHLPSARIQRFRLALATKPHDVFFLCHVPSQNLDNDWNSTNVIACEQAKARWTQATSRRDENVDGYNVSYAKDPEAFPAPGWPKQTLGALIETTFNGRMIDRDDHPALLRLIGAKQSND